MLGPAGHSSWHRGLWAFILVSASWGQGWSIQGNWWSAWTSMTLNIHPHGGRPRWSQSATGSRPTEGDWVSVVLPTGGTFWAVGYDLTCDTGLPSSQKPAPGPFPGEHLLRALLTAEPEERPCAPSHWCIKNIGAGCWSGRQVPSAKEV